VATGLKVLTKSPISATALLRGAKEAAQSAIGARRIRDLNVRQHEAAETKSNRDALQAGGQGPDGAAAGPARVPAEQPAGQGHAGGHGGRAHGPDYFDKLQKPSTREKIELEFRDQIDQLLGRYDLRKGLTPEQAPRRTWCRWKAFVEKLAAMKFAVDVPESLIVAPTACTTRT
jgi:hypothetical protein